MSFLRAPKFFKLRKPKSFDYQPLYYDEAKEQQEEREKRVAAEIKMENSPFQRIHEGRLRSKLQQANKQRTFRLALIITIILVIVYLLLFNG